MIIKICAKFQYNYVRNGRHILTLHANFNIARGSSGSTATGILISPNINKYMCLIGYNKVLRIKECD